MTTLPDRRRRRLGAASLAAVVLVLAGCGGADRPDALPDVALPAVDGGSELDLGNLDGPAVVNLWATWCAPCRRELPAFEQVHQARGDTVRFVGINIGDDAGTTADYLAEVGVTFEQYLDIDSEVTTGLETATLPVTAIIGPDGDIAVLHNGPMSSADLERAIDGLQD